MDDDFSQNSTPKYKKYSPYQDLAPNSPHLKLYNLPTAPEHLFEEQASRTHRNAFENLTFYTGTSYVTGAVVGSVKGSFEGLSAARYGESLKIRSNRVLNMGGLKGRTFGNATGVLGLLYAGMESTIIHNLDVDDARASVLAGVGTGAVYRVVSGFRSGLIGGVVGGIAVGAVVYGKPLLKRFAPNLPI
ncbi:mitochondrial import inner membrane translocase subunit TIM23-3-like [Chenopodium quinoa]|uniref:mitochondrial import inner membrane translocase subunit TIM23-3-like n=1 Tax=Chenopodium quinoa TaxID=63459 RepID=UPI000B775BAF|nr:mitochondrial import inner membrane translocase subunit TIM23-3-like [Chenopodium quinoa]